MTDRPTPPPTAANIRAFLGEVKDDLRAIKDDTRHTRDDVISLKTDLRGTKGRVKKLEEHTRNLTPHSVKDCPNTEAVTELRDGQGMLSLKVNTAESEIAGHGTDLNEIKTAASKRIFWVLGVAVVVIGSAFGWFSSKATMEANVAHLTVEQAKVSKRLDSILSAQRSQTTEIKQTTRVVKNAAEKVSNGHSKQVPVDVWWRTLDESEKRLLIRRGIRVPLEGESSVDP